MNKNTFGDTPAAIYLANRLDELNSKSFTRKISKAIHNAQTILAEIRHAHDQGTISTRTLSFMTFAVEDKVELNAKMLLRGETDGIEYKTACVPDELAINLMLNLLKGDIKCLRNQAQKMKYVQRAQDKEKNQSLKKRKPVLSSSGELLGWQTEEFTPVKIKLSSLQEGKSSTTLINKSIQRLKRLGKRNDFYA